MQQSPGGAAHAHPPAPPSPLAAETFSGEHTALLPEHVSNASYGCGCRTPKLQVRTHTAPCITSPLAPEKDGSNCKASGTTGSSSSNSFLAPPCPNWNIWGSQLWSTWGWMGLTSLRRAHPLTRCFSPSPAEWRGEAGDVGLRAGHHPSSSSHALLPPGLSSLLCHSCPKATSALPQQFKGSTLLRYTRGE